MSLECHNYFSVICYASTFKSPVGTASIFTFPWDLKNVLLPLPFTHPIYCHSFADRETSILLQMDRIFFAIVKEKSLAQNQDFLILSLCVWKRSLTNCFFFLVSCFFLRRERGERPSIFNSSPSPLFPPLLLLPNQQRSLRTYYGSRSNSWKKNGQMSPRTADWAWLLVQSVADVRAAEKVPIVVVGWAGRVSE